MKKVTNIDRCLMALHDHGTRPGATSNTVIKALKADGFTPAEIQEAVVIMRGETQ